MFDFTSIHELDSQKLELIDPTTEKPCGAVIELASARHPKRKRMELDRSRELTAKMLKKRGGLKPDDVQPDPDQIVDLLVASTLSWDGFGRDGSPLPFSSENVRWIYENCEWVRDQALAFMNDSANFLQSTGGS